MRHNESVHDLKVVCFPKKLVVDGRPELLVFPLQIAFMTVTDDGRTVRASSYIPNLATYATVGTQCHLLYDNILGGDSALRITFDTAGGIYTGDKLVDGCSVGQASGRDWNTFFVQLAGVGIAEDERCEVRHLE